MPKGKRAGTYLKERYGQILHYTGLILIFGGIYLIIPSFLSIFRTEEVHYIPGFLIPSVILFIAGFLLWKIFKLREEIVLTVREGGVIVLIAWLSIMLFSAVPFMSILNLSFTHSFFESVSGWTTTGLSVVNVEKAPHSILLWRSMMQLAGGAGFAILMLAAITGPVGHGLTVAEGRGEQLVPHVKESATKVLIIYSGYVVAGTVLYFSAGMNFFDSLNHIFSTVSTGGFSTHSQSIGYWDSPVIELATIIFMILGSLNFLTAYLLFRGNFRKAFRSGEVRTGLVLSIITAILLFFFVGGNLKVGLFERLRISIFETITAITTTGFTTTGYSGWAPVGIISVIFLMIVGGSTGSTAGGIKLYRFYLALRSILWEIKRAFLPGNAIVENYVWRGERRYFISPEHKNRVLIFILLYILFYFAGSSFIAAYGYGLRESFFEFASALGTVGLSVGITSQSAPAGVLWAEILGMFLGRLEIFIIVIGIIKIIRDTVDIIRYK